MPNWQHDPALNFNYNWLNDVGQEQQTRGRDVTNAGVMDFAPVANYYRTGLSGDTGALEQMAQPQIDSIGKQFENVRSMIASQPRGGGKTSTLAQLPIEHIKTLANIISNTRNNAAGNLERVAGTEANIGAGLTGQGIGAVGNAANIAAGGRNTDIANGWKSFFKGLAGTAVGGLGEGAGGALISHFIGAPKTTGLSN